MAARRRNRGATIASRLVVTEQYSGLDFNRIERLCADHLVGLGAQRDEIAVSGAVIRVA